MLDRPAASPPPTEAERARRANLALALVVTVQLMIVLDATVVNVALPAIERDLSFSPTALSWVLNAYALAFGGLLLLGGRAGDLLGRRRVFMVGVSIFAGASLLGGLAPTSGTLLAARALQGVGGAIAAPSVIALIITAFAEGPARAKALGVLSAVSAGGGSLGLLLGGVLTDLASWRWSLIINVPIALAVLAFTPRLIDETERRTGHFDVGGAFLSTTGVTAVVFGVIHASTHGWGSTVTVAAFVGGAVLLAGFVAVEQRAGDRAIMPLRLFASKLRASAYLDMALIAGTMFGFFFFVSQFMQRTLGYDPIETGFAFIPLTAAIFAVSTYLPRVLPRVGAQRALIAGGVLTLVGLLWLTNLSADSGYATGLLVPLVILGTGVSMAFLPLNLLILHGVRGEDSGAASGVLQAAQQLGGSVGIAVLVSVYASASGGASAATDAGAATNGITHALTAAAGFAVASIVLAAVALREPKGQPQLAVDDEFVPTAH
ncbi:MAG: MFS transporter [Patulibacter minatonensis]